MKQTAQQKDLHGQVTTRKIWSDSGPNRKWGLPTEGAQKIGNVQKEEAELPANRVRYNGLDLGALFPAAESQGEEVAGQQTVFGFLILSGQVGPVRREGGAQPPPKQCNSSL